MCSEPEPISYRQIKRNAKTGDIILFSGTGWESLQVKVGTNSPFSHIGMVIQIGGKLYLWHAAGGVIKFQKDLFTSRYKDGPQLNWLLPAIRRASGSVYYRRLVGPREIDVTKEAKLLEYMEEASETPYEEDDRQLLLSAYDGPFGKNSEDWSSYFCSELIAKTYEEMGVLGKQRITSEFVPGDFAERRQLDNGFKLASIKRIEF